VSRWNKILVILSIVLGSLIYILFRQGDFLFTYIFEVFTIKQSVNEIRDCFVNLRHYLPKWVIYSLPDGLYLFSVTLYFKSINKIIIANKFLVILVTIEIIQLFFHKQVKWIGTFDFKDLIFYTIGYGFARYSKFFK